VASAGCFAAGAIIPLAVAAATPMNHLIEFTVGSSLLSLLVLGGLSAKVGGAKVVTGALRVALWSALAMAVTAGVGALWGRAI
jgi:VIT1/CCC1 family predicted Fe2+/Mn2+ transporter